MTAPLMAQYSPSRRSPSLPASLKRIGIGPLLREILARRPCHIVADASLPLSKLEHHSKLAGAHQAASILWDHICSQKNILILADYDADGATSTCVAMTALLKAGAKVRYLIPDRVEHGYGLTPDIAHIACNPPDTDATPKPDLIITVDNGVSAHAGVAYCNQQGVNVLITDHHLCPPTLPDALLVVNPNQPSCSYPSKAMAGCGVIFMVMWALLDIIREQTGTEPYSLNDLLPFVAIGTVADVVSMDLNNRILVNAGLNLIRQNQCTAGITALAHAAGVPLHAMERLTTTHIGFGIGPRINAAGRLESMSIGVRTLLCTDPASAAVLVERLSDINQDRKMTESDVVEHILLQIHQQQLPHHLDNLPHTLVFSDPSWHQGIIGIAAGRLKERFYRPTFVFYGPFTDSNGTPVYKGSGRSIPGLHLRDALDAVHRLCPQALLKYGGHAAAAGATIHAHFFEDFKQHFEDFPRKNLSPQQLPCTITFDGETPAVEMGRYPSVLEMRQYPWGQNFAPPLFMGSFLVLKQHLIGRDRNHLLLDLKDPRSGKRYSAIWFKHPHLLDSTPDCPCTFAYRIELARDTEDSAALIQLIVETQFDDK